MRTAAQSSVRERSPVRFPLQRRDLRRKVRAKARKALVVFAVDASDSMAVQERMSAAKGAALSLLRGAYLRRDRVAVVVFEGESARIILEPTASVALARERLRQLPLGGTTPLAAGLRTAWEIVRSERLREPSIAPMLVLLSDGRGNVPLAPQADPHQEILLLADRIRADGISSVVVDAGSLGATRPELQEIAERLGARLVRVGRRGAGAIVSAVRAGGG